MGECWHNAMLSGSMPSDWAKLTQKRAGD